MYIAVAICFEFWSICFLYTSGFTGVIFIAVAVLTGVMVVKEIARVMPVQEIVKKITSI